MSGERIPESEQTTNLQEFNEDYDWHTPSYITLKEFLEYNYDAIMEDRRTTKQIMPNVWDGSADAGEGNGKKETVREFLGEHFFKELDALKTLGEPENVRIVFWFDN